MPPSPEPSVLDGPDACVALLEEAQCLEAADAAAALRRVAQHLHAPHPLVTRAALDLCAVHPAAAIPHVPDVISASPADAAAALDAFSAALAADRALLVAVAAAAADLPLGARDAARARATLAFALSAVDDADVPAVTRAVLRAAAPPTPAATRWAASALRAGLSRPLDPSAVRAACILFSEAASARHGLAPAVLRARPAADPPHPTWLDLQAAALAPAAPVHDLVGALHAFPSHAAHAAALAAPFLAEIPHRARSMLLRLARAAESKQGAAVAAVVHRVCSELLPSEVAALAHALSRGSSAAASKAEHCALVALVPFLRPAFLSTAPGVRLPPDILVRRAALDDAGSRTDTTKFSGASSGKNEREDCNAYAANEAWSALFIGVRKGILFGDSDDQTYAFHTAEALVARAPERLAADMVELLEETLDSRLTSRGPVFFLRILTIAAARHGVLSAANAERLYHARIISQLPENALHYTPLEDNDKGSGSRDVGASERELVKVDVGCLFTQSVEAVNVVCTAAVALRSRASEMSILPEKSRDSDDIDARLCGILSVLVLVPEPCITLYKSVDGEESRSVLSKHSVSKREISKMLKVSNMIQTSELNLKSIPREAPRETPSHVRRSARKSVTTNPFPSSKHSESIARKNVLQGREVGSCESDSESEYVDDGDESCISGSELSQFFEENDDGVSKVLANLSDKEMTQEMPISDLLVAVQSFAIGVSVMVGVLNFACCEVFDEFWLRARGPLRKSRSALDAVQDRTTEMSRMYFAFLAGMRALDRRWKEVVDCEIRSASGRSLEVEGLVLRECRASWGKTCSSISGGELDGSSCLSQHSVLYQSVANSFPRLSFSALVSALLAIPGNEEFRESGLCDEPDYESTAMEGMLLELLLQYLNSTDSTRKAGFRPGPAALRTDRVSGMTGVRFQSEVHGDVHSHSDSDLLAEGGSRANCRTPDDSSVVPQVTVFEEAYEPELIQYRSALENISDEFDSCLSEEVLAPQHVNVDKTEGRGATSETRTSGQRPVSAEVVTWASVRPFNFGYWRKMPVSSVGISNSLIACLLDRSAMYTFMAAKIRRKSCIAGEKSRHLQECVVAASLGVRAVSLALRSRLDSQMIDEYGEAGTDSGAATKRDVAKNFSVDWENELRDIESAMRWSTEAAGVNQPPSEKKLIAMLGWISKVAVDTTLSFTALDLMLILGEVGYVHPGLVREAVLDDLRRVHEYSEAALWIGKNQRMLLETPVPKWIRTRRESGLSSNPLVRFISDSAPLFVSNSSRVSPPWYLERYRIDAMFSGMCFTDAVVEAQVWIKCLSNSICQWREIEEARCISRRQESGNTNSSRDIPRAFPSKNATSGGATCQEPLFNAIGVEPVVDFLLDLFIAAVSKVDIGRNMSIRRACSKSRSPVRAFRSCLELVMDVIACWRQYREFQNRYSQTFSPPSYNDELERQGCMKVIQGLVVSKRVVASIGTWYSNPEVVVGDLTSDIIETLRETAALSTFLARQSLTLAHAVKSDSQGLDIDFQEDAEYQTGARYYKKRPGRQKSRRPPVRRRPGKVLEGSRRTIPRLVLHAEALAASAHLLCQDLRISRRSLENIVGGFGQNAAPCKLIGEGVRRWRRREFSGSSENVDECEQEELSGSESDVSSDLPSETESGHQEAAEAADRGACGAHSERFGGKRPGEEFWASVEHGSGELGSMDDDGDALVDAKTIIVSFKKQRR